MRNIDYEKVSTHIDDVLPGDILIEGKGGMGIEVHRLKILSQFAENQRTFGYLRGMAYIGGLWVITRLGWSWVSMPHWGWMLGCVFAAFFLPYLEKTERQRTLYRTQIWLKVNKEHPEIAFVYAFTIIWLAFFTWLGHHA